MPRNAAAPSPRRRHQPGNLDAIEPVRIAFRALAPRRGGLPDGDRRDTERTVIEVEDVGIEAEGLQECSVHEPILPSRALNHSLVRSSRAQHADVHHG